PPPPRRRIASGRGALRNEPGVPRTAVYADYETTEDDLADRLADMDYGPYGDLGHLHYLLLPTIDPFDTRSGGAALLDYCRHVGAISSDRHHSAHYCRRGDLLGHVP